VQLNPPLFLAPTPDAKPPAFPPDGDGDVGFGGDTGRRGGRAAADDGLRAGDGAGAAGDGGGAGRRRGARRRRGGAPPRLPRRVRAAQGPARHPRQAPPAPRPRHLQVGLGVGSFRQRLASLPQGWWARRGWIRFFLLLGDSGLAHSDYGFDWRNRRRLQRFQLV